MQGVKESITLVQVVKESGITLVQGVKESVSL